jgi:copper chaperone CopZ
VRSSVKSDMAIRIGDMTCAHCKRTIETAVSGVAGVEKAVVDLKNKTLHIQGGPDRNKVIKVIKDAGYTPE